MDVEQAIQAGSGYPTQVWLALVFGAFCLGVLIGTWVVRFFASMSDPDPLYQSSFRAQLFRDAHGFPLSTGKQNPNVIQVRGFSTPPAEPDVMKMQTTHKPPPR